MPAKAAELPDWTKPQYADALATRDVGAIFRHLKACGWTQRAMSRQADMSQSEVSDFIKDQRKALSIALIERVAQAFSIPPGLMGLAYTGGSRHEAAKLAATPPDLIKHAIKVMIGDEVERATYILDPRTDYKNVGKQDATVINAYFLAIQRIENQYSGQLVPAQALIRQLQQVLRASMSDDIRLRLSRMEGWMNSFAGWCAIDAGNFNLGMSHFSKALAIAGQYDDHLGKCRALFSAGKAEMHYGEPEQALKLYQLAVVPSSIIGSKLYAAGLAAHSAWAVSLLKPQHVQRYVTQAWDSYSLVDPAKEYEGMHSFFNRTDILGVTGQAQVSSKPESAIEDLKLCLASRTAGARSTAFETATLAHAYLTAGYQDKAVETGRTALGMLGDIRSARKSVRLAPLKLAAYKHGSAALTELADDLRRAS